MALFRLQAGSVVSQAGIDSWAIDFSGASGSPPTNPQLLEIVNHYPSITDFEASPLWAFGTANSNTTGSCIFNPDDDGWFLDGSPTPTAENDLPSGFTIDDAQVEIDLEVWMGFLQRGSDFKLKAGAATGSSFNTNLPISNVPPITKPGLLTTSFGVQWAVPASVPNAWEVPLFLAASVRITGHYHIDTFTWTLNQSGRNLEVHSDGINPDLTTVQEIVINYTADGLEKKLRIETSKFTTWTAILLIFEIPPTCDELSTVDIKAVITGTEHEITTIVIE